MSETRDFSEMDQLKNRFAELEAMTETFYMIEVKINGTWYIFCVDDTHSTKDKLKIRRVIDYHARKNVTRKWHAERLIEKHHEALLEKANEFKQIN